MLENGLEPCYYTYPPPPETRTTQAIQGYTNVWGIPIKIGKNSYLGENSKIWHYNSKIGAFCCISWNVCIGPPSHPQDRLTIHTFTYRQKRDDYDIFLEKNKLYAFNEGIQPVLIGNDVWIGCNVVIKGNITVGDGAIIGAGSVVTKDVPPYAIVGGVPAKIIRYRFDEETISELLKLKWWELDDDIIKELPFNDIKASIKKLKEIRGTKK